MKSMINTRLSTATAVAAGGTVPLGTAVHGFGNTIALNGAALKLAGGSKSYFRIIAHCTCEPTAAGSVAFSILDGTTVLDFASGTAAAIGDPVDMTVIATVYIPCCCTGAHSITFQLDSAASVTDMSVEVEQL